MERKDPGTQLTQHVVICNVNSKVKTLVGELHRAHPDLKVVLIVQDENLWNLNPAWHPAPTSAQRITTLVGCPTDQTLLRSARIGEARAAIILADPNHGRQADARSTLVAVAIERANPQVHTVIELLLSSNLGHLDATEVNEVICLGEIAEKLVAQSCITPGSSRIFAHLLTTASDTSQIFLEALPPSLAGRSYREAALSVIDAGLPVVLCGFVRGDENATVVLNPRPRRDPGRDTPLQPGDRLIVIASRPDDLSSFTSRA